MENTAKEGGSWQSWDTLTLCWILHVILKRFHFSQEKERKNISWCHYSEGRVVPKSRMLCGFILVWSLLKFCKYFDIYVLKYQVSQLFHFCCLSNKRKLIQYKHTNTKKKKKVQFFLVEVKVDKRKSNT